MNDKAKTKTDDAVEQADTKAAPVERLVMWRWHNLLDMAVLTNTGDKMGEQVAVVYSSGAWHLWGKRGSVTESGTAIGVYDAKCAASFAAIQRGLLDA